jgi:hypothetical protein
VTHCACRSSTSLRLNFLRCDLLLSERLPYRSQNGPAPEFCVKGVQRETRELLRRMKGEKGQRVRANSERLSDGYRKHREEGGGAQVNLEGLRKYVG